MTERWRGHSINESTRHKIELAFGRRCGVGGSAFEAAFRGGDPVPSDASLVSVAWRSASLCPRYLIVVEKPLRAITVSIFEYPTRLLLGITDVTDCRSTRFWLKTNRREWASTPILSR
jgi:hypothetical protein